MSQKPKGKSGGPRKRSRKETLPMGFQPRDRARAATEPPPEEADTVPPEEDDAAPPEEPKSPESGWERQSDLITSAQTSTVPPRERTAGSVNLDGDRLPEAVARELLHRTFSQAGLNIQADYQFHHGDTLVVLDGFDPHARIGYQYLSHADADVVTDHDEATEKMLEEMSGKEQVRVLVIHDHDTPTGDELLVRIQEFLGRLGFEAPTG